MAGAGCAPAVRILVLQGPGNAVSRCLQRIMCNDRHHDLLLMRCDNVQERQFWEGSDRVVQSTPSSVQDKVEELFDVVRTASSRIPPTG